MKGDGDPGMMGCLGQEVYIAGSKESWESFPKLSFFKWFPELTHARHNLYEAGRT